MGFCVPCFFGVDLACQWACEDRILVCFPNPPTEPGHVRYGAKCLAGMTGRIVT